MRVLFISRSLPYMGGRERIVEDLMGYFSEENKVSLIAPDEGKRRRGVNIFNSEISLSDIEKFVKKQNPEVISCHTFYLANLAIRLSKKFNIPLIFTLHGVFVKFYDKDYSLILRRIYKNSEVITTVSESYKKQLSTLFNSRNSDNIKVIKNGVDDLGFRHSSKHKNLVKNKFKLPINKKIIITPARLNKIKGLDYLVRAARKISQKNSDVFFLISSPKGRKNDSEKIYKNKLKGLIGNIRNIKFLNLSHDELLEVYPACDLCLLPSLIEGISLSVLEAMSSGLIVAASKVGGNVEIIKSGNNGFLFKASNSEAIVRAVNNIMNMRAAKKRKIINNAKKTVGVYFSKREMLKSYESLFKNIILNYENK